MTIEDRMDWIGKFLAGARMEAAMARTAADLAIAFGAAAHELGA